MSDRDRVTAIAELRNLTTCRCEAAWTDRGLHETHCVAEYRAEVETLAEALDTIDKARHLHSQDHLGLRRCRGCGYRWPCPTWQALNGGNESGDDGRCGDPWTGIGCPVPGCTHDPQDFGAESGDDR